MEKSFDFGRLLKNHEKKHKAKPEHLMSVAGGLQRRLQQNFKTRKSSRSTVFDHLRNLTGYESPAKAKPDKKTEVEHRKLQLEKWKQEKAERKKEAAVNKKKPFLVGAAPSAVLPPPPPPPRKVMPSSSGRVTRSHTIKQNNAKQTSDTKFNKKAQSFAPKNATFQPPQIKNLTVLPTLNLPAKKKEKTVYKFEPILNNILKQSTTQTRSKALTNTVPSSRITRQTNKDIDNKSKGKFKKISPKRKTLSKTVQSSSASSGLESSRSLQSITEDELTSSTDKETKNSLKSFSGSEGEVKNSLQSSSSSESETVSKKSSPVFKITPRKSLPRSTKIKNLINITPKNPVPKSESSSEEKLRSPKSPVDLVYPLTPEQIAEEAKKISPCVTMSRGKDNARKEIKKKMQEGLLDEDTSDIDCVNHFRRQLASEIKRMTEMCEIWDKIQEQTPLSDSIQELALSAVGQARLLMSKKLVQFRSLVEMCAQPDPTRALVTPADLNGFWDMVFMQIENIDMRFKKLEDLRSRNWVEDAPAEVKKKAAPKNKVKKAKPAAHSRLRDVIAAARKAKQQQESPATPSKASADSDGVSALADSDGGDGGESKESGDGGDGGERKESGDGGESKESGDGGDGGERKESGDGGESKTFEAGFFCVRSPVRSPARATPAAHTLLKAVLSSEAKKSASKSSSFAMLRASILSKNMDHEGIALLPQTPINLNATPSRSILKSAASEKKKSSKKSIKVVLFDDSDNDIKEKSDSTEEPFIGFEKETESTVDSLNPLVDKEEKLTDNKENSRRKSKLVRQDATTVEGTTAVMTRSRRKTMNLPVTDFDESLKEEKTPKRSARKKKALQQADTNV